MRIIDVPVPRFVVLERPPQLALSARFATIDFPSYLLKTDLPCWCGMEMHTFVFPEKFGEDWVAMCWGRRFGIEHLFVRWLYGCDNRSCSPHLGAAHWRMEIFTFTVASGPSR